MELQDKDQAWQDLHKLIHDNDCMVQESAVRGLILAFPDLPYKTHACQDLLNLIRDEFSSVRVMAIYALGQVFGE